MNLGTSGNSIFSFILGAKLLPSLLPSSLSSMLLLLFLSLSSLLSSMSSFQPRTFLLNCLIFFNPLLISVVLESGAVNSFCFLRCFCAFYFAQMTSEDRVLSVKNQYVLENKLKRILPPQNIFIKRIQSLPYKCITQFPTCHDHVDVFLNDSPISVEASTQLLTSTLLPILEIKSRRK